MDSKPPFLVMPLTSIFMLIYCHSDEKQFDEGRTLIEVWAKKISAMGGNIVAEHGVGKIKKNLFRSIPLPERLKVIRSVKQQLDPNGIWNPGNMLNP